MTNKVEISRSARLNKCLFMACSRPMDTDLIPKYLADPDVDPNCLYGLQKSSFLIEAARHDNLPAMKILMEDPRTDINAQDASGFNALMVCAAAGFKPGLSLLLGREDLSFGMATMLGNHTASDLARLNDHGPLARLIDAVDHDGPRALMRAEVECEQPQGVFGAARQFARAALRISRPAHLRLELKREMAGACRHDKIEALLKKAPALDERAMEFAAVFGVSSVILAGQLQGVSSPAAERLARRYGHADVVELIQEFTAGMSVLESLENRYAALEAKIESQPEEKMARVLPFPAQMKPRG